MVIIRDTSVKREYIYNYQAVVPYLALPSLITSRFMLCQWGFLFERATLFVSEVTVSQVSNILIITLLKRLKEHFEYTSDLTWKKNMLDIYTNMDCVMC